MKHFLTIKNYNFFCNHTLIGIFSNSSKHQSISNESPLMKMFMKYGSSSEYYILSQKTYLTFWRRTLGILKEVPLQVLVC